MSDTPRTDAAAWREHQQSVVDADFARKLEREIARVTDERNTERQAKEAAGREIIEAASKLRSLRAENATLKANDPLNDAANEACGELPEGWTVSIVLERGSATVWLVDPADDDTDVHEDDASVSDLVREAIRRAKEAKP